VNHVNHVAKAMFSVFGIISVKQLLEPHLELSSQQ